VLVIGSGGREHALAWRLSLDPEVTQVVAAPGNPGLESVALCRPGDPLDPAAVLALADAQGIDLTVVGPEAPLERGLADRFRHAGRPIVGPSAAGAALECSKVHAKAFMADRGIPTARFVVCDRLDEALATVRAEPFGWPLVVKADGLAGGKGVVIAANRDEAERAVRAAMAEGRFGAAGSRLVLEECLTGPEVSFFVLADGRRALLLGTAQDHKRIFDDDRGPNTGGMGAFAPSPLVDAAVADEVQTTIVDPVLEGLRAAGDPYIGFLYVSLMLTPQGPKVIEFNVRMGDPETQAVMPIVDGPFARPLYEAATGALGDAPLARTPAQRAVGVVLASAGYPDRAETGREIHGIEMAAAMEETFVFHAGTRREGGRLVSAGGRVLTVVGRAGTFEAAMDRAYAGVSAIRFDGMQYRRDIGKRAMGLEG
jgi:phosphoribosylamine--glycine ligase